MSEVLAVKERDGDVNGDVDAGIPAMASEKGAPAGPRTMLTMIAGPELTAKKLNEKAGISAIT